MCNQQVPLGLISTTACKSEVEFMEGASQDTSKWCWQLWWWVDAGSYVPILYSANYCPSCTSECI